MNEETEFRFPWADRRLWAIGGLIFLILATAFVGLRTVRGFSKPARIFDWDRSGMSDFGSLWTYSRAFADGVNPYSIELMERPEYVAARSSAPFCPVVFLTYLPLKSLSYKAACIVFFVFHWLLLGVLAFCCIRMCRIKFDWGLWLWIFGFLVFSRPGHLTLFTGYFTLYLVIGSLVALHYSKSHPWVAGIGFLFASIKPTWVIPLTILMLARRDFKAVAFGILLTSVLALGCFAWLASHSDFASVIEGIKSGQQAFHEDPTEEPFNTWTRVDVAGMVAKAMHRVPGTPEYLVVMLLLLVIPCIVLWKVSQREVDTELDPGAGGWTAHIVVLAMLVTLYHHSYDCLIIAVSLCAFLLNSRRLFPDWSRVSVYVTAMLLTIPMLNYVSTRSVRNMLGLEQVDWLWQWITVGNGVALTLALVIAMACSLKQKTATRSKPGFE